MAGETRTCDICGEPMEWQPSVDYGMAWFCPLAPAHARIAADAERIAELEIRVAELEAALRLHGSHLGGCAERDFDGLLKCDCGLRVALEGGPQ